MFRIVFENFYLNKELFYLINHNRHPLLDAFFSKFYLLGKGWVLIPIFIGLFIFQCFYTPWAYLPSWWRF